MGGNTKRASGSDAGKQTRSRTVQSVLARLDQAREPSVLPTAMSAHASTRPSSRWSAGRPADEDDELYALSDNEDCKIPVYASESVRLRSTKGRPQYPALIIPTEPKQPAVGPEPANALTITTPPVAFDVFRRRRTPPTRMTTPSLDGSSTSEELASSSCPTTPDLEHQSPIEGTMDLPVQLDKAAYDLLCKLSASPTDSYKSVPSQPTESPQTPAKATKAVVRSVPQPSQIKTWTDSATEVLHPSAIVEPQSATTVPSPATFFESLGPLSREAWLPYDITSPPTTAAAESFYAVPLIAECPKDSTSTASGIAESSIAGMAQQEPEPYERRTKEWLYDQWAWTNNMAQSSTANNIEKSLAAGQFIQRPATPPINPSRTGATHRSPKKLLRTLESVPETAAPDFEKRQPSSDCLFTQGYGCLTSRPKPTDAFLQRQSRAEAAHVGSTNTPQRSTTGSQSRSSTSTTSTLTLRSRKDSATIVTGEGNPGRDGQVVVQHDVMEQAQTGIWELQATQEVFGPDLVSFPISTTLVSHDGLRILDYGGEPSYNWGSGAALRYRKSAVITVPMQSSSCSPVPNAPSNHKVVRALSHACLPFPDNHFDLISARSMHQMLRTHCPDLARHPGTDEYDLVLNELRRILKPGGYLDFHLMDAELFHPGPQGAALGDEFADALRRQLYDPQASRYFLPRLRNAGFASIKRAWIVLPAADVAPAWIDPDISSSAAPKMPLVGSTECVRAMTGLIGAGAWERWMLSLQREVGGSEAAMQSRIARAMEESGRVGAGWRCLVGWARKEVR